MVNTTTGYCTYPLCSRKEERGGFCFLHAIHFAGAKVDKPKKPIAKVSDKKKKQFKKDKPKRDEQLEWFKAQVKKSKGQCIECGSPINKTVFSFAIMAVAHVLPKRSSQFPSVATHPDNSIELCVTNGCHAKFDKSWEDAATMKCWPIAVEKFIKIYPAIAPGEKKYLPDILRQEVF